MSGEALSARISYLKNIVKNKRNYATSINDQMINLRILQKFATVAVQRYVDQEPTSQEIQDFLDDWMATHYGDNPSTTPNEAIPADIIALAYEALSSKEFEDVTVTDLASYQEGATVLDDNGNEVDAVREQYFKLYSMREAFNNDAKSVRRQIENLHAAKQEEAGAKSG